MPVNPAYCGRVFPAGEPYEVSRVKIAEFADAIGDPSPLYRDRSAARAVGHPDVIAPPTFAVVLSMAGLAAALADPGLGIDYSMVVQLEQKFSYSRPIVAGDVLSAQVTLTDIKKLGRNVLLTTSTQIAAETGEHVCTALASIVERGA